MNNLTQCKVCGYDYKSYYPWGLDGKIPTYDICICCGIEFGYEDCNGNSILIAQKKWENSGFPWKSHIKQPADWNPSTQLKSLRESVCHPRQSITCNQQTQ